MNKENNKKYPLIGIIILSVIIIILARIVYYELFICIAEVKGMNIIYNGSVYEEANTSDFETGDFLCKTKDGHYNIYSVRGDNDNNFLWVNSFLDDYLYKKEGYEIPESGNVTAVYIKNKMHDDDDFISVLQELENVKDESYSFKTDNIYSYAENIKYCYNGCPVGGKWICRIAHIDGKWIYINTDLNDGAMRGKNGSIQLCSYTGTVITDDQYISVLEKYISK